MKTKTYFIAITAIVAGTIFTSCTSSEQKVEDAQEDVAKANENLVDANAEYLADVELYKKETANRIAANNKSIAEFNVRIEKEKKEVKADYKKRVAELEQKNSDMQKKMDEYKADGKDNWEKFKSEFNHDMEELGKAFNDLTTNNVK